MSRLNPDKLKVEFMEGTTEISPVIPRRYTLTHSDITGDLFLMIGQEYALDKITPMRDEVLGEWYSFDDHLLYNAYLQVGGQLLDAVESIRNYIFRRELPLALEAIRYGDRQFFDTYPKMDQYPIFVYFLSDNPKYNKTEYWGTFADYDITSSPS